MLTLSRGNDRARARRGSALVLSLVAVTTVVVLAASFSQFASAVANRQAQAVNRKRAFYLAEAGLAEAFTGLSTGKSGAVGSSEAPALLGDGVFWVEATELDDGLVRLESTGMIGTGRAELSLVVRRGEESVAALGVFSEGAIALAAGSVIDAYDSEKGAYTSQADKNGAVLGSNGNITINGIVGLPSVVKGDVTPGPEGALTLNGSVNITGSTSRSHAATELPAVEVPDVALGAAEVHSSPFPLVIPPGSAGYESLTVGAGAEVIVQGPAQLVFGALNVQLAGQLTFDTSNGPIDLYVTDALQLEAGSIVSTSSTKPEHVTIQVPGTTEQPVALRSTGAFHGMLYAPETSVTVGSSFEMFGALVAQSLSFDGNAKLHYDLHLARLAAEAALPRTVAWRLVEVASTSSDLATDPFDLLGLDKNALELPSKAHADQALYIDYYDFADVYHRYSGPESSFDWNVVKTVIQATRDGVEVLFPRTLNFKRGTLKSPGVLPIIDGPMI